MVTKYSNNNIRRRVEHRAIKTKKKKKKKNLKRLGSGFMEDSYQGESEVVMLYR